MHKMCIKNALLIAGGQYYMAGRFTRREIMITVRRASLRDIDDIIDHRMKLLYEMGKSPSEVGSESLRNATRGYFIKKIQTGEFNVFVAETAGVVVSMTCIQFIEHPPVYENIGGTEGHVMDVYTEREWRGKGIAATLLGKVVEYAKENNATRVILDTIGSDTRLYEKIGFRSTTSEMELLLK